MAAVLHQLRTRKTETWHWCSELDKIWIFCSTFKVAPEIFQVFTIHALVDESAVPLMCILLQDKTEASNIRVFEKVRQIKPLLNALSMMADFETAIQNAVRHVFPNFQLVGCLFHLGQCLWRKVQELHLADRYRDDENIHVHVKMLLAISFVPIVTNALEILVESCPREIHPVLDCWEDNCIGRQSRNRRAEPRFSIPLWNVHDRVTDGLPRTNNSVEAWHRSFQQTIDCHHPSFFKLIGQFQNEQDKVEIDITCFQAGDNQEHWSLSTCNWVDVFVLMFQLTATQKLSNIYVELLIILQFNMTNLHFNLVK